ncbi:SRPBCC domain-containing protein [Nitratireductor sp. GCM10026969]|uniref:SRPBCC domain-containing protein n=1 Tax=Nitratireductor sp. GCM10026969 TaxID=3252645 RepID=UPI00360CBD1F
MDERGYCLDERAVRFERMLPGPVERVWAHLTESDLLPVWFGGEGMAYRIAPREGGAVRLADGHIRGVVTRWKPPYLLAYTWNVFDGDETESAYPESHLTFALEEKGDEVLLILTHRPILPAFEGRTLMGWHMFLDLLSQMLAGRAVEKRETAMRRNAGLYDVELPSE